MKMALSPQDYFSLEIAPLTFYFQMEAYASSLLFRPPFQPLFDSVTPNSKSARDTPPFRDESPNGGKGDGGMSASKKVSVVPKYKTFVSSLDNPRK